MTHSNILSSDFGLGRAVRQSDCQEMRMSKSLITKGSGREVSVTDGSTRGEKSESDPRLEWLRVKHCHPGAGGARPKELKLGTAALSPFRRDAALASETVV